MLPRLQEDARATKVEEDAMRTRKAAAARAAAEAAAQDAACRLVAHLDELHEQLAALRVQVRLIAAQRSARCNMCRHACLGGGQRNACSLL